MKYILTIIIIIALTNIVDGQEILWDSTLVVNNDTFRVLACRADTRCFAQIIKSRDDTVTVYGVSGGIEISRFNADKYPDIILPYLGNNYTTDLFLYDKTVKSYKMVKGFMKYPNAKRLKNVSSYYYSYHRSGCADMNWESDLFYIDNYITYKIGNIYGKGCEEKEVVISKVVQLDLETGLVTESKLETFPIDTIDSYEDYKWGFIEDYWNNNFNRFRNKNLPSQ